MSSFYYQDFKGRSIWLILSRWLKYRLVVFREQMSVLTKTRNNLKPPKTIWNQLKPATLQYFLLKISYAQVEFILILRHKVFFRQIWSQKLRFSKLTQNWYRDTLLYPYFEFNVYFSKIFDTHIFLGKFDPKIWSSSNSLKIGIEVDCCMLITVLMFILSKFLSFIFFGQIWSQNLKFSKLTEICYRGTLLSICLLRF